MPQAVRPLRAYTDGAPSTVTYTEVPVFYNANDPIDDSLPSIICETCQTLKHICGECLAALDSWERGTP